ncbi:MAG TPA: anti-sigma factor [Myxococcota bacterium]|nr:anti-sigma factor [Myxococcota bacterium]
MDERGRELSEQEHAELTDLVLLAPLGGLLPDEQRRVALHASEGCARCEAALREAHAALDVLALAAPELEPSPRARDAVVAALEAAAPLRALPLRTAPPRDAHRSFAQRFAAVAAGLALLLSAASLFVALREGRETRQALALADAQALQRIAAEGQQREALAQRVGAFEQEIQTRVAASVSLALAGEASFGTANARVVMDAAGQQVLLLASRIPPLPEGRTYQLWVIVSGAPRSLGVFAPDREGRVVYVQSEPLELPSGVQAAVSIEPSGGVPQPTGPIVLVSR